MAATISIKWTEDEPATGKVIYVDVALSRICEFLSIRRETHATNNIATDFDGMVNLIFFHGVKSHISTINLNELIIWQDGNLGLTLWVCPFLDKFV